MEIHACELEEERAAALAESLEENTDWSFQGDAFLLNPLADARATVLYLNPPYDFDREERRLEQRFLRRFTEHLYPGFGFLFFLIPYKALEASAAYLAQHYVDLRAWRLPEPEFQAFGQVLVVGRRAAQPLSGSQVAGGLLRAAADPFLLPVLSEVCDDPFTVSAPKPFDPPYSLFYDLAEADLAAAVEAFEPWQGQPVGVSQPVRELLGARFETACPPKPVHIALALSSGMFDGQRLEPNDPRRHPPLLAKGHFERQLVPVSDRHNAEGELTSTVTVERPRLVLTALRLDTYAFHTLQQGTVPTGGDDVALWNAADLITNYDRSLARLLAQQFPALHDPRRADHQIVLPALARKPFKAQAQAIQAALKLLSRGLNPFFIAEVGTGKSTMALATAAALLPEHHAATTAELRRVGLQGVLPQVRKVLILCPPHLLKSWCDQAAAVVPDLGVQIVSSVSDLDRPATFYVLSREAAKLSHGHRGVAGACPRCGAAIAGEPAENATNRARCKALTRTPLNLAARLAVELAHLLAPFLPRSPLVDDLVSSARFRERLAGAAPRPFSAERFQDFHRRFVRLIPNLFSGSPDDPLLHALPELLFRFASVLGFAPEAFDMLRPLVGGIPAPIWDGTTADSIRQALTRLQALSDGATIADFAELKTLETALELLQSLATWYPTSTCDEPLYQAIPEPRRYPLAKTISRRYKHLFDLVILDEAHEFNNSSSAQSKAAHRLTGLPGVPTLVLTGSLMGGYASSLFANFWALSPAFRREFGRDDLPAFVSRYGFRKILITYNQSSKPRALGSQSDRELSGRTSAIGEAPGLMPTFILRHLLPVAIFVHKSDLDVELPALTERPFAVSFGADPIAGELQAEYNRLQDELLQRIRADRFDPERSGRLLGALVDLPSYLDRATDDLPPYEIRYPDGELIAQGATFPASWRTPKELRLLERVGEHLTAGDKVLVFLRHTGSAHLPNRLIRLLRTLTPKVAWLDVKKVPAAKREAWIDEQVIAKGIEVLLVNPNAVRTGLNNLVTFSAGIWYELDLSTTTLRQANGRLHRIGQVRPVSIETPFYSGTAQQIAFELIAQKASTSLRVDALDLRSALEAAGALDDEADAMATALSLGNAVYNALEAAPRRERSAALPQQRPISIRFSPKPVGGTHRQANLLLF